MINVVYSSRFKKDLRLAVQRGKRIEKLTQIIEWLCAGTPLPPRCRDHALTGNYSGFRDCHIEPDWILIYRIDDEKLVLVLSRCGSHSDLF